MSFDSFIIVNIFNRVYGTTFYVSGGMQDYNYVYAGCMEVSIELSCCKFPAASSLPQYWRDNKDALLRYISQVHMGEN